MTQDTRKRHSNFTAIPNMLCEGAYAHIKPDEKWLFVCLKALCKGQGTRYLSLRFISKKTGFPLGTLSKKMHILHKCGLIHCELKKQLDDDGQETGNAQYHISIPDKWEENDDFYGITCSPDEHLENKDVTENVKPVHVVNTSVRDMNEPVHHVNESVHVVNEPVHVASTKQGGNIYKINKDREDRRRESTSSADDDASASAHGETYATSVEHHTNNHPHSADPVVDDNSSVRVSGKSTKGKVAKRSTVTTTEADDIPVEAVSIMDDWDSLFKRPYPRTSDHIAAAKLLIICQPTKEDLKSVRAFIYKTNPEWYREKGVKLSDIAKYFGKWQSQQEQAATSVEKPTGYTIDEERNARNKARMAEEANAIRAARAAQQKQQEVKYAVSR